MGHASDQQGEGAGAKFEGNGQQRPGRLSLALLRGALTVVGGLIAMVALAAEPIEIIVPFGQSSGADTLARYRTPALQSALAAPVIAKKRDWLNR